MRNSSLILKKGILVFLTSIPFLFLSQKQNVTIHLHHFVDNQKLVLDDSTYTNAFNQKYTISKFNYYIGNLILNNINGTKFQINDFYFVSEDEEKIKSKTIELKNIPEGEYSSISFIIGVDSLHNCSGAQSGSLDPINAMFWTWNTGYIFLKLEGNSNASSAVGHILEYHIGGYKEPDNCIRTVTLPFKNNLKILPEKNAEINIKADISELLKVPSDIDFSKIPVVNNPLNSKIMADNYSDIFQLMESEHEK